MAPIRNTSDLEQYSSRRGIKGLPILLIAGALSLLAATKPAFALLITENPVPSAGIPLGITSGPDGNLWFTEGSNSVNKISKITTGSASYSTTVLTVGSHAITSVYSGDLNNMPSTSAVLLQIVNAALIGGAANIPTLSEWGMILLCLMLSGWGAMACAFQAKSPEGKRQEM